MSTYFLSTDDVCECQLGASPGFIKDTVCGHNALTNLFYLQTATICLLGVVLVGYFHAKILGVATFAYKSRLKLLLLFSYIYFLGAALKAADPLLHYQRLAYILIQDSAIALVFVACVYLSIWGKVLQQTYDDGTLFQRQRSKRASMVLDVIVLIICLLYSVPLLYTIIEGQKGYSHANPYHAPSIVVFSLLPIAFMALGLWLLSRLRNIRDLIFSPSSQQELRINLLLGALIPLARGLYDWVDVIFDLHSLQVTNCQNTSVSWAPIMGAVQLIEALPLFLLFLFLTVSHFSRLDGQTSLLRQTVMTDPSPNREILHRLRNAQTPFEENPIVLQPSWKLDSDSEEQDHMSRSQDGPSFVSSPLDASSFMRRWDRR